MPLPPLTHHEILPLVEPFTRRGRRVDLAASDRIQRRLVFKPVEHEAASPDAPALREELELESPFAGIFRLTRLLTPASGPHASLVIEGPRVDELLALVESIPPRDQFRVGAGYTIALRQQAELSEGGAPELGAAGLLLTEAVAELGDTEAHMTLHFTMPTARRYPADIRLEASDLIELPEDLIAVVGWDWAPLKKTEEGCWQSKLRLRGKGPARSRSAEEKLERTVRHLARTLSEPPRRFHERLGWARWRAAVRRTIPVLTFFAVILGALALPFRLIEHHPVLRAILMQAPLLVIALSFTLQESARIEIAPRPRALDSASWRRSGVPGAQ